ncbi:hypothetical protein [Streptomyces sp. NPDC060031]|uniref:hypothetical protein n=1 Tax=Streptomyces sp. NPDC060031 TaxID=3347043 RepID=UPI00367E3DF1
MELGDPVTQMPSQADRGPGRIGGGVSDHQLDRPSVDSVGVIDSTDGQFESHEQIRASLGPTWSHQWHEGVEPLAVP